MTTDTLTQALFVLEREGLLRPVLQVRLTDDGALLVNAEGATVVAFSDAGFTRPWSQSAPEQSSTGEPLGDVTVTEAVGGPVLGNCPGAVLPGRLALDDNGPHSDGRCREIEGE